MNMIKKKAASSAVLLTALLSGCSSEIEGWEIDSILSQCSEAGGISEITTIIGVHASCRNGAFIKPERKDR